MERDPRAYLWDALQAADAIDEFTRNLDADTYGANPLVRSAVERQFEIIGEALNRLSRYAPDIAGLIPDLREIVSFRNVLIHGYAAVDVTRVWETVVKSLPGLRRILATLLEEAGDPPNQGS